MQLDKYSGCMKCGAKVVTDAADPEIGTCVKCKMMQCINARKEEFSAHIMVKGETENIPLRAFGKVVEDISQKPSGEITMVSLLKAKPFTVVYCNGIIQSVVRKL